MFTGHFTVTLKPVGSGRAGLLPVGLGLLSHAKNSVWGAQWVIPHAFTETHAEKLSDYDVHAQVCYRLRQGVRARVCACTSAVRARVFVLVCVCTLAVCARAQVLACLAATCALSALVVV
jgi:hypothetical protein